MFTFQQNKFTECQPCPVEVFKSLTQAQLTAETIDEHRRPSACGAHRRLPRRLVPRPLLRPPLVSIKKSMASVPN